MVEVQFIHHDGRQTIAQVRTGQSLMQAALELSIDAIAADCGGLLTCATCHVIIGNPWPGADSPLPPASQEELAMLDFTAVPRQAQSRLSCQINLTPALNGLRVHLPSSQY